MHPIILRLPFLPEGMREIHSYGLMMVLGFLAGYLLAYWLAKRAGADPGRLTTIMIIAIVAGLAGARLVYVVHFWAQYADGPWRRILDVRDGGLEFYGGVILAMVAAVAYLLARRLPVRLYLDVLAPALLLGLAFGRVGCFLNGCCYGKTSNLPWAVSFPYDSYAYWDHWDRAEFGFVKPARVMDRSRPTIGQQRSLRVHPSQLYSMANALVLCGILCWYLGRAKGHGQVFCLALILYGLTRFGPEMTRVEPIFDGTGLTISQNLSIVAVVCGAIFWIWIGRGAESKAAADPEGK